MVVISNCLLILPKYREGRCTRLIVWHHLSGHRVTRTKVKVLTKDRFLLSDSGMQWTRQAILQRWLIWDMIAGILFCLTRRTGGLCMVVLMVA